MTAAAIGLLVAIAGVSFVRSRSAQPGGRACQSPGADDTASGRRRDPEGMVALRTLEESERRFRSLITATAQVVWTADAEGVMRDSPMWRALTGQPIADGGPAGWLDAVHPDDRQRATEAWLRAVRSSSIFEGEYRIHTGAGEHRWFLARGVPVRDDAGAVHEWVGTCADIHERKRAEEAEAFLLEAARVLASSLDLDTTLRAVCDMLLPQFGDYCLIYLAAGDGAYDQVGWGHVEPEKRPLLAALSRLYRLDPTNPHSVVAKAITRREPTLVAAVDPATPLVIVDPEIVRIHRALAPVSYMAVPLIARDDVIGAMVVVTSSHERRYDEQELAQVALLGARAALAIDNARHHAEAQAAQDRALRAAQLESQLALARLEALRAQLNPHFLFNALNTVAMLVRRNARTDAIRAVVSLSELLRKVLAGTGAAEVPLREELAVIDHYLGLEQLRFGDRLRTRIAVAPDAQDGLVPSLILQPLVENAVQHGIARSPDGGMIEVSAERQGDRMVISVRDDGAGLPEGWDALRSEGVGLANTRERLDRLYRDEHGFEVRNAAGGGVLAIVTMPFHLDRVRLEYAEP